MKTRRGLSHAYTQGLIIQRTLNSYNKRLLIAPMWCERWLLSLPKHVLRQLITGGAVYSIGSSISMLMSTNL